MKKGFFVIAIAATVALYSCSKSEETGQVINPQDKGFVHMATLNNAAEIILGQLAADSSETPAIKAFGQNMVSEHSSVASNLEALAANLGIATPDTLTARHEQLRQRLLTLKGRSFDSLYIHNQVADHRTAINLYENAHGLGNNIQLKDHAREVLPIIIQHHQEAQTLAQGY